MRNITMYYHLFTRYQMMLLFLTLTATTVKSQVGNVIWEDDFNTLNTDIWAPDIGDGCDQGLCGWGNQELQSYESNNVYVADIPGEPGNKALVLEARNETSGSRAFTSGKVTTDGRLSVQYGLVEVRMRVPNLETGLWPAAWLLGTSNQVWPDKGEIDMMEMGHSAEERERQGHPGSTVNNYVGANAIFQTGDGVGSIAYDTDYNQPYVSSTPMNDRFVTYRLYWEPTQMRFTVVDNGVEHDLYTNPFPLDPDGNTSAFTRPFYLLLNLAVGGNFTDALTNDAVTAPLPGKMYVDYVRVSEWNGHGAVEFNYSELPAESGVFGVYTDDTPTSNQLTFGTDGEIYAWGGTVQEGTTLPYEGNNVIAWETTTANSWFGGGVANFFGKNMSNFADNGSLKFKIKIPADVSFRIGITDNYTNESYVNFPAGQTTHGLSRNGEWGQVEIPLSEFAGLIAFQNINYMFAIVSVDGALPASTFQFAIDDIVWDDGYGSNIILSNIDVSPNAATITEGETQQFSAQAYDQNGNPMNASFTWSSTGGTISSSGLYTGTTPGNFTVTASSTGINGTASVTVNEQNTGAAIPGIIEAEDYNEGGEGVGYHDTSAGNTGGAYRSEDVDIEATGDATGAYNVGWIAAGEWLEYDINATAPSNTYDLSVRVASPNGDGRLHIEIDGINVTGTLAVPNTGSWQNYVDITSSGISISPGSHVMRVVFDAAGLNINYIEGRESEASQELTTINVSPTSASIDEGQTQQFNAQALDQNGNPMSASFTWSTTGGSINSNGLYTGSTSGSFTVTASSGSVSGNAMVTVNPVATGTAIPGALQSEDYNAGGEGVGYHDTSAGNTGGQYRSDNVDIELTGDAGGGYNIGWIDAGEWLEYDINATAPSNNYELDVRVASPDGNGRLHIEIDGINVTGTLVVPNTGSWQSYTTVTASGISISQGAHVMRVYFEAAGLNINYVEARENPSGCTQTGPNGDYTVEISEGSSNPTLTFVPGYSGIGNPTTILYYGTSPTGSYPGYSVTPNTPYEINAASGETIYFYYTYSVPEGGERNSSADRHSFVVGNCDGSARASVQKKAELSEPEVVMVYPNPAWNLVNLKLPADRSYSGLSILDVMGKSHTSMDIKGKSLLELDVSSLPVGTYFIRLYSSESEYSIRRFIKK